MYTYLIINILVLLGPLLMSFEKTIHYASYFKKVFITILIVALPFLLWDYLFTREAVWGFNPKYLIGIYITNLPIEEILFFITIPFAILFIYKNVSYKMMLYRVKCSLELDTNESKNIEGVPANVFYTVIGGAILISVFCFFVAILNYTKLYTFFSFIGAGLLFLYTAVAQRRFVGCICISYLIVLVPFLLVNGILTGAFTAEPIVWYSNEHTLGLRLLTIPVEDFAYCFIMVAMNILVFQYSKSTANAELSI